MGWHKSNSFWVPGVPVPMPHGENYRNKWAFQQHRVVGWKTLVGYYAKINAAPEWPLARQVPVALSFAFHLARNAGDLKNLIWSTEDALAKIVFANDAQVVCYLPPTTKQKATPCGCQITVWWEACTP